MAAITTRYAIRGELHGMPVVEVFGLIEGSTAEVAAIKADEVGRVALMPVPRVTGIVAKSLDGISLTSKTVTLTSDEIGGALQNCLQVGKTRLSQFAPEQPSGFPHAGERILNYSKTYVQLAPNT